MHRKFLSSKEIHYFLLKFWLLWNATKSNRAYYYENDQKTKLISQKYRWFCDNTSLTENNPKLQNLPYDYFEQHRHLY
jgi:cupin superfamily acireductone dioxygenase involved in methionine salvage